MLTHITQNHIWAGVFVRDYCIPFSTFCTFFKFYFSDDRKLYDILQDLSQSLDRYDNLSSTKINVTRTNPLDGARRSIRRTSFNPTAKLSVRFADDFGTSEGAVDQGGPTRELFRLLLKQISELPVFCGPVTSGKLVVLNAGGKIINIFQHLLTGCYDYYKPQR